MFKAINAVQVHVSLDEIEPKVWRRLVLPSNWTLEHLHFAIQAGFNWWNSHLHEFRIGGLCYGDVEVLTEDAFDDDPRVFSSRDVRLRDFERGAVFSYLYDFGDSWRHTIVIEEFGYFDATPKFGSCIDGARARPPEDVGGCRDMSVFWKSCRTKQTRNTTIQNGGVVDISIRHGLISQPWTRTYVTLYART